MASHDCPMANELEDGIRCEIKALDERYTKLGELELVEKPGQPYDTSLIKPFMDYALITKRTFAHDHKHTKTTLQINSQSLLGVLKEIVKYYPSVPENFDEPISIESPFTILHHHLEELEQFRDSTNDDTAKMHIQLLLDYLKAELGDSITKTGKLTAAGYITFPLLWTIFKPGELLYEIQHGHIRLYKLESTVYDEDLKMGNYMKVTCSYTDYDGKTLGRAKTTMQIYEKVEFAGPSKIDSLSIFPLKFIGEVEQESIKAALTKRGERFMGLQSMQMAWYEGVFLGLKAPPRRYYMHDMPAKGYDGVWLPHTASSRVVLDGNTFRSDYSSQVTRVERSQIYEDLPSCAVDQEAEDDPMLFPSFVYGFSLARKVWCKLFIDNIGQFEWDPNAFDSLVLPQHQKTVVRSLVNAHKFPSQFHEGSSIKGKGLIMLLHGTPGSGKTLTAEVVAEHTKRPLLIVSSSELGAWKENLEHELKILLRLATIWQAIVLIDEADVYLEERITTSDKLDRNGLVAVFLRELEYFQGILMMTSNRVDVFDPAIKSRIHLALKYSPPGADVRNKLWKRSLDIVPAGDTEIGLEALLSAVGELRMNGREISNTMNTARTLARDLGEKLNLDHIKTIVQIWLDFHTVAGKGSTPC